MRGKSAVVMIGLDACDAGLAEGFATSGHLPNLGRLFTSGARCRVRNPMGLFVGALWPTFSTGVRADRHGVHCWDEIDVTSYKRRTTTPHCDHQLLWERLSEEDRRVAVLDVPHMQGDKPVNGVQFAEWGCHDRHFGFKSWPLNLAGDMNPPSAFIRSSVSMPTRQRVLRLTTMCSAPSVCATLMRIVACSRDCAAVSPRSA